MKLHAWAWLALSSFLAAPLAALAASVLYFELRGPSPATATQPAMPNPMDAG